MREANSGITAVVAGATGLVGRHLLEALAADSGIARVLAFGRRSPDDGTAKVEARVVDFERLEADARIPPGALVFCALGTTIRRAGSREAFFRVDHDYPLALGRAARAGGAVLFSLVSSLGADPESRTFYLRVKGETERDLVALGLPSLQIFRPSLLLGERRETRAGEEVAARLARVVPFSLLGPLARYEPIPAVAVARALAARARDPKPGVEILESRDIRRFAATGS